MSSVISLAVVDMRSCILNSSSKKRTAYRVTYQPPQADAQGAISFLRQPARYSVTAQTPLQGLLPRARYRQYFLHGESGCTLYAERQRLHAGCDLPKSLWKFGLADRPRPAFGNTQLAQQVQGAAGPRPPQSSGLRPHGTVLNESGWRLHPRQHMRARVPRLLLDRDLQSRLRYGLPA